MSDDAIRVHGVSRARSGSRRSRGGRDVLRRRIRLSGRGTFGGADLAHGRNADANRPLATAGRYRERTRWSARSLRDAHRRRGLRCCGGAATGARLRPGDRRLRRRSRQVALRERSRRERRRVLDVGRAGSLGRLTPNRAGYQSIKTTGTRRVEEAHRGSRTREPSSRRTGGASA